MNLAVVCSAEQIIRARIDKADGNKVSYSSGAVENAETNRAVKIGEARAKAIFLKSLFLSHIG